MSEGITLLGPSKSDLQHIISLLPEWVKREENRFGLGVRVGKLVITVGDLMQLNREPREMARLLEEIIRYLREVDIPVPAILVEMVTTLRAKQSFTEISPGERVQIENMLEQVEGFVL